jgi:hypothetical protein
VAWPPSTFKGLLGLPEVIIHAGEPFYFVTVFLGRLRVPPLYHFRSKYHDQIWREMNPLGVMDFFTYKNDSSTLSQTTSSSLVSSECLANFGFQLLVTWKSVSTLASLGYCTSSSLFLVTCARAKQPDSSSSIMSKNKHRYGSLLNLQNRIGPILWKGKERAVPDHPQKNDFD